MTNQSLSATSHEVSTVPPAGRGTFVRSEAGTSSNLVANGSPDQGVAEAIGVAVGTGEPGAVGIDVGSPLGDPVAPIVCGPA
jgi:hypothetical protein